MFVKGDKELLKVGKDINSKEVIQQLENEEYETFDDYLEIVLEFAYMVLFAEAFPLAPLFILIVNNIELRSDIFKLTTVFKRPEYFRKRNIGSWHLIIQIISTLSVFTNLLFTMTYSEESMFGYTKASFGASQTLKFFVLEHLVFIVIILLRVCISSTSSWVKLFLERREYQAKANKWIKLLDVSSAKK